MPAPAAKTSSEQIVRSLTQQAVSLWGPERAAALRDLIQETAQRVWRIAHDPAPSAEEPGFYF